MSDKISIQQIPGMVEIRQIPEDIVYRIYQEGDGPYIPQYKRNGKWVTMTTTSYNQSERDSYQVPCRFFKIDEAERCIEDEIKSKIVKVFYKDTWVSEK